MTRTRKTNPAYAHLAYRRSILRAAVALLQQKYTPINGEDPERIICEEVFQADAEVPEEEINQFVEELQEKEAFLGLEMKRFEFVRQDNGKEQEPEGQARQGVRQKATGKGRRKS